MEIDFILDVNLNLKASAWPWLHVAEIHGDKIESVKTTSM